MKVGDLVHYSFAGEVREGIIEKGQMTASGSIKFTIVDCFDGFEVCKYAYVVELHPLYDLMDDLIIL